MKNFKPSGFKKSGSNYEGKSSFGDGRKQTGRYDMGRPARTEDRRGDAPELFKTNCTTCGKSCEVPFRPDGVKPVLCRDCFAAKNAQGDTPSRFTPNERIGRHPEVPYANTPRIALKPTHDYTVLTKQLGVVETKVNQILELIKATEKVVEALPLITPTVGDSSDTEPVVKKVRKPKSTSPAVKKAAVKKKVAKKAAVVKKQTKI